MIDFSTDAENDKVKPIISENRLQEIIAYNNACLYEVDRYRYSGIVLDFEGITSVDYADILQKEGLRRVTERLIENKAQYDQKELNYLVLRNLINYSWKLDAIFLLHLRECAEACQNWGTLLRRLACDENLLERQPYWLRNEQTNLFQAMEPEMYELLSKVELVMIKSNKVFPKCSSTGAYYFIQMDSGIYPFLFEWIRVLLCGYRINAFNEENEIVQTTEPVKTGAALMLAVVNIIRGNKSAFVLPEPAMNFSPKDYGIAKEVVTNQIEFLLGHEYGHIYAMGNNLSMEAKEEELYADDFSVKLLEKTQAIVAPVGSDTDRFQNDIQPESGIDRKIEDIELLFLFYDVYFYASELMGYKEADDSHPHSDVRRKALRKYYTNEKKTPLLDYAESIVDKMKRKMREL